jgi:hypothetical protein
MGTKPQPRRLGLWVKMISNSYEIRVVQPKVDRTNNKILSLTVAGRDKPREAFSSENEALGHPHFGAIPLPTSSLTSAHTSPRDSTTNPIMDEISIANRDPSFDEDLTEGEIIAIKARDHGWLRWRKVTEYLLPGRTIYRAACPNYKTSQDLTQKAVNWLKQNEVNSIISFNSTPYNQAELDRLNAAGISYHHYETEDWTSPSIKDLKEAAAFHESFPAAVTLIHCGYGHGRTGTGVSAIQLYANDGVWPTERQWIIDNKVETKGQIESLRELAAYYNAHPREKLDGEE